MRIDLSITTDSVAIPSLIYEAALIDQLHSTPMLQMAHSQPLTTYEYHTVHFLHALLSRIKQQTPDDSRPHHQNDIEITIVDRSSHVHNRLYLSLTTDAV
jgi:hypothetical protein